MVYLFLGAIIGESVIAVYRRVKHITREQSYPFRKKVTATVAILTAVIIVAGHINTYIPTVAEYSIDINKKSSIDTLRVVFASDIHAGNLVGKKKIGILVDQINKLNPDIVIIAGDLFDRSVTMVTDKNILDQMRSIHSKYGIHFAFGNHDYFDNSNKAQELAESIGIKVLRDKTISIDGAFYLAGREDIGMGHRTDRVRRDLSDLFAGIDRSRPVIVIDHQPKAIEESINNNADLVISGHTHNGQFWPLNLFTGLIFQISHGYKKIAGTHFIVSSGFGTWGPPVRNTGFTEVVCVDIRFTGK
jgi:predicted MPP superfamily phosphohydrolase